LRFVVLAALVLPFVVHVVGCGGGGADSIQPGQSPTGRVRLTVAWAERTRNVAAPGSALSVTVRLPGARVGGGDLAFTANRNGDLSAHPETYESDAEAYTGGNRRVDLTFYASPGGTGSVVGTASATMRIAADGTVQDMVTDVRRAVASVAVVTGQHLSVGEQAYLTFTARNAGGAVLAVSPGSGRFSVAGGNEHLTVGGIVARALAPGEASVAVTIDGVTSAPAPVTVLPAPRLALVANGQDAQVVAFLQLLQSRNITPTRFDMVPEPDILQEFDVLMVSPSGAVGTADAAKLEAFLNAGRGVVLLGTAPAALANGTPVVDYPPTDISAVARWFGGVTGMSDQNRGTSARPTPGAFPLPPGVEPGQIVYEPGGSDDMPYIPGGSVLNPAVDRVLRSDGGDSYALAYELPPSSGGGRVYWQFHPYGLNSAYTNRVTGLLIAGTYWAAQR
jgi:hypothetical protein